jgi:hypothetical protein
MRLKSLFRKEDIKEDEREKARERYRQGRKRWKEKANVRIERTWK